MIHGANCNCKECESALSHKIESSFKDVELAKRFTELTGLELPENYNAADILNRMKEFLGEERYKDFLYNLLNEFQHLTYLQVLNDFLNDYILNATATLREAVEFLEQTKGE